MDQSECEIISANDEMLRKKVKLCVSQRRPFIICADRRFPYRKRLIRMLKFSYEGEKDTRWMWTAFWDAYRTGEILASRYHAVEDNDYNWHYKYLDDGLELIFDPPK